MGDTFQFPFKTDVSEANNIIFEEAECSLSQL